MKTYIGVKQVKAEPMTKMQWRTRKGLSVEVGDNKIHGYRVVYPDGYESWSPKAIFEDAYYGIETEDKISHDDVIGFADKDGMISKKLGESTAVVQARCRTGFEITKTSACVDPANFDPGIGTGLALDKIADEIWGHLGFVLQWAKDGLSNKEETTQTEGE